MPLLDIPIKAGLAEGVDSRLIGPGQFIRAKNVEMDKFGRYVKRLGYGAHGTANIDGSPAEPVESVHAYDGELLTVTHDDAQHTLHSYVEARDGWTTRTSFTPTRVSREAVIRKDEASQLTGYATVDGFEAFYHGNTTSGTYILTIREIVTGAVVLTSDGDDIIDLSATADQFVVMTYNGATVDVFVYNPTTGANSTIATGRTSAWAIMGDPATNRFFTVDYDGANWAVTLRDTSGGVIATSAALAVFTDADIALNGSEVALTSIVANQVYIQELNAATLLNAWGPLLVFAHTYDAGIAKRTRVGVDSAGNSWVVSSGSDAAIAGNRIDTYVRAYDGAGVPVATSLSTILGRSVTVAPWAHDTMMYTGLMSSYAGPAATPDDNRFFSVNIYALNAQSSELTWQATSAYLESSGPFSGPVTRMLEVSPGVYRGAVAISLAPGTAAQVSSGIDIIEYDFTMSTQASAEADTTLAIDGGALTTFDGIDLVEVGFPESPVIRLTENLAPVSPDLPMPDGTYAYQVVWEWYDARGNLHRSAPSNIASITLAAGGTSGVDVHVRSLRESLRIVSDTDVRAIVYRSEDASSGPFYRLFPRGNEYDPQAVNDPSVWEISYGDETGDDIALLALGYGSLYADTDLPNVAPPPIAGFAVHKNRVWAIDAEHRKGIWYSKWMQRGLAPEFSDSLRFEITDSPGDITAIASLGESLAVFTESRIYYIQGSGPNDTGAGGGFTEPITVSSDFGCTDAASVQSYAGGVLFRGAAGMYQLTPGMQLQYIGDAVKDTVAQYDQTRGVRHDIANQRVVWLLTETFSEDSIFLVYDYFHGSWYTWEIAGSLTETCHTFWRGVHVFGGTAGTYQRGLGDNPGMDPGGLFPVMQLRTNWIQTGAISGVNRCRKAYFNVRTLANVDLTVTTYHDYDETTSGQSRTWTIAANQQPTLGLRLARAKSQSYMFQFTDAEDDDDESSPQGVAIVGITLELQQKRGTAKIAATFRK